MKHLAKPIDAIALLGKYAPEMAAMKSQLKMKDKHIDNLETAIADMKKSNAKKGDVIYDQREEISQLREKVGEINRKQSKLQKVIYRFPPRFLNR